MTITDIKNFLKNEPLIKQLKLNCNKPGLLKHNIPLLEKILNNSNNLIKTNSELIYLIKNKNNLENLHIFCECGKKNGFFGNNYGYSHHCSIHCEYHIKDKLKKMQDTCERNNGVKNPYQKSNVRQKVKEFFQDKEKVKQRSLKAEATFYKNHGCKHNWASKDPKLNGRATCKERYGNEEIFKTEHFKKVAGDTNERNYGVRSYSQSQEYRDLYKNKEWVKKKEKKKSDTIKERYDCDNTNQIPGVKEKRYNTMKKNGTLGSQRSKIEVICFDLLKIKFPDAKHTYRDKERYPFNCDAYIPSKDLFIEFHFDWTHGYEPFDQNNLKLMNKLNSWKEKAKTSKYYKKAISTWTDLDIRKLETFINNKLNYKIFYNEKEFNEWFKRQ